MRVAQETQHRKELRQRFEECVERCADSLFRTAFRLTGNRTLATELVQETYLNAWRSIESLKDPEKMRGWMFAILRNQFTNLLRAEKKSAAPNQPAENMLEQIPNSEPKKNDTQRIVQEAVGRLDDKHKMPLLLVSMEGMSVEEAATILELPRGTVLSRLHRARQKLKEILTRQEIPLAGYEVNDDSRK